MTAQVYRVRIVGEEETFPFRPAFWVSVRIMPDWQIVTFGPYSMN